MPVLSNAQNFTINGGQFMDITNNMSGPTGIDILLEASCPEAAHDSSARSYPPRCFPGTREQYIEDIVHWAVPTLHEAPAPIYWMKGPAGVGKSAVAQTCAEELKDLKKLGAAFFFSITGRNKPENFFPSIAYQLSTIHPGYRDLIDNKIRHDKTLVNKAMSFQFRYLIDEPLRELGAQGKGIGRRIAVIVDGLDECEGAEAQCEIIRIVASAASSGTLPLCWAFFSRPEPHIEATFARTTVAPHCHKITLPISCDADGEIRLYLRNGFENILQRHNTSMQSQWPSAEDMEIFIGAAGGSFIYATTVLRFVDQLGSLGLQKRLRAIIDVILDRRKHDRTSAGVPFAELDAFYTLVLQRVPSEIFPSVYLLLALLCEWGSVGALLAANILGLSKEYFKIICNHASAVVHVQDPGKDLELDSTVDTSCTYTQISQDVLMKLVPQVNRELGGRVSFYHKSFDDFLLDPARSGIYCVKGSKTLAKHYLKIYLNYDRSYCWKGSELVLAPGFPDSASSLSYPYTNELVNSSVKALVYIGVGQEDLEGFSTPTGLGALDANCDFRKRLHILTHSVSSPNSLPHSGRIWGCERRAKFYPGTCIAWVSLTNFDVNGFKSMIEWRRRANSIKRYHPDLTSRIKTLFCNKSWKRFESALFRMGHGEKSAFWYWEINYESQHYRELRTTNLAEGEKLFREEDFDSWPEYGHEFKSKS